MTNRRKQLEQLSKEALIESHLLLEGRIRTLEKQVADLRELLQSQQSKKSKPRKTAKNSSLPPSKDEKANKKPTSEAKRGPKHGHPGVSRERSEPDETVECRVTRCTCCGEDLSHLPQHEAGRHQVIDIPKVQPVVRDIVRYGRYCPGCETYQRADLPPGVEPDRVFGPYIEQLVLYLHYAHPLSYQRVQRILEDICGLSISQGALVNMVSRAKEGLKQAADTIRSRLQEATVVGSDETTLRVDGITYWQWVFQTSELAYFVVDPTRAAQVITDVIETPPEVWVSDLLSSQLCHPANRYQICLAHQVRDLQYAIDAHNCDWATDLQTLFYDAMKLNKQDGEIPVQEIQQRLDRLLDDEYPDNDDSRRLWRRYRKHRDALFLFLEREDVPPTNNASERALRNSVIYRKVTGGFRTDWGAELYANFISILETARRQGDTIFETLSKLLASQPAFSWQGE
jgi:transposase